MFGIYFTDAAITGYQAVAASDSQRFARFFHGMLEHGVYFAPAVFEAGFASAAHGQAELDQTLEAADKVFAQLD